MNRNPFIFQQGDLPNEVLTRATIPIYPRSKYHLATTWYYLHTNARQCIIPPVIWGTPVDNDDFINFMNVTIGKAHMSVMNKKQLVGVIRIMYLIDYKDKDKIWSMFPPSGYSQELSLMVKQFDGVKAAEIANRIDWGTKVKKEFLEKFDKQDLVELILKMSSKKRRRSFDRSSSPC